MVLEVLAAAARGLIAEDGGGGRRDGRRESLNQDRLAVGYGEGSDENADQDDRWDKQPGANTRIHGDAGVRENRKPIDACYTTS